MAQVKKHIKTLSYKTLMLILKILNFLTLVLFWAGSLVLFSMFWLFKTFPHVKLDELLYQINAPIEGTNSEMIQDFILTALLPSILVVLVAVVLIHFLKKKGRRIFRTAMIFATAGMVGFSATVVYERLDVYAYMNANNDENKEFIENYYVDPANVNITFPEQKRNLLMIYLESTELTFSSKEYGGAFDENIIPEMTNIGLNNETFSGSNTTLNGAYALSGTTWTIGAMFGSSSGLPLKIALKDGNSMDKQVQFFETTTVLGDILEQNGYHNTLLIGSDATFGGRRLYYSSHGNYEILDHPYMLSNHKLPSDNYSVWWGYEDMYLYQFAQEKLTELGNSGQPFNLTMLTVDTHFEDGYVCALCGQEHGADQYANVYSCASRQLGAFLDWCAQQPWYANTTIVITGDHPTMDSDFCKNVPSDYGRKVYTAYINAAAVNQMPESYRTYSTFDTFPTTIAALGAAIEGERLGLGTNLFSGAETLTEALGVEEENLKLMADSKFMEERANIVSDMLGKNEKMGNNGSVRTAVDK